MSKYRKRLKGFLRACCEGLAVAGLASAVFAPAAEALPAKFWGVVPQALPTTEQIQRLKRGGVDSIRISIPWGSLQAAPGVAPDWSSVDAAVRGAAQVGIEVLPYVYGAPSWAVLSVPVPGSHGSVYAPETLPVKTGAQRSAWASFLQQAVARYGPNGSFWTENPTLAKHSIRTWQIWNEENFKYFVVRPNPAEYGKLVKVSYAAIKGADPGAKIVLGGLFARPKEAEYKVKPPQAYFATDFLEQMYKKTPGIKKKFNGVALHPYTYHYQQLTPDIEEVRNVLKANHDAGKSLWITELGWSSQHPTSTNLFAKGMSGQATQLKGAFKLLQSKQAKWRIQRVFWFSVDDQTGSCNFCDGSGLFGPGFTPKPAWNAYVKFAGGTP